MQPSGKVLPQPAWKRPATLADVAREAGVVAMTASRAINGSGYVSEAVRTRVMEAAEKLLYQPNMLARHLKGRRTHAIGVMLPDIANPFASELLTGIRHKLDDHGYTAFVSVSDRGVEQERAGLRSLVDHRVDGLIIATRATTVGDQAIATIVRQGIPLLTIGRTLPGVKVDTISADDFQGAFDLTAYLAAAGHRRIAFLGISAEDAGKLHRFGGFASAMEQAGLVVQKQYVTGPTNAPAFSTQEDGFLGMRKLAALKRPPTAVFARNDFTAIGALRAAYELGLRIPEDIAVAGFDNIPLAAYTSPPLTTVAQPIREQGELAAHMLVQAIEGESGSSSRQHIMPCELIVRQSTAGTRKEP